MKKATKRFWSILLVLCLTASMAVGCTTSQNVPAPTATSSVSAEPSASSSDSAKNPPEPFKLDWYINVTHLPWPASYKDSKLAQMIKERTGAEINFIVPAGEPEQYLNTLIASGTLPDVMSIESSLPYRTKLAKAGAIYPLNDLMDQYAPDFYNNLRKDIFNWFKEADGKTYGLPNYYYSKQDMIEGEKLVPNSSFLIRKDLAKQVGADQYRNSDGLIDVTADQYLDLLRKAKNLKYKDMNVIPLQLTEFTDKGNVNANIWLTEYFAIPFENQDGSYVNVRTDPKYFEALSFLNKAFREDLISKDNFTEKRDQVNQKVSTGRVFSLMCAPQEFLIQLGTLYDSDNEAMFEPFVLRNNEGDAPVLRDISGFGYLFTMISKNTKNPDKIIKMFEFLNSNEGITLCEFGKEGDSYTLDANGRVQYTEAYKKAQTGGTVLKEFGRMNLFANWLYCMRMAPVPTDTRSAYVSDELKRPMSKYSYTKQASYLKFDPSDPSYDEMINLGNKIDLFWGKQLIKIIMASSDETCRQEYDATLSKLKEMGNDKLDEYNNAAFQRAKEALGIKHEWPGLVK